MHTAALELSSGEGAENASNVRQEDPNLGSCPYPALTDWDRPIGTATECEWIRTTAFLRVRETSWPS